VQPLIGGLDDLRDLDPVGRRQPFPVSRRAVGRQRLDRMPELGALGSNLQVNLELRQHPFDNERRQHDSLPDTFAQAFDGSIPPARKAIGTQQRFVIVGDCLVGKVA